MQKEEESDLRETINMMNEKIERILTENQEQKQQIFFQGEMIRQLQQKLSSQDSKPLISQRNDNPVFCIPFLHYNEIEPNHDTDHYFKNLLIWTCRNYKNVKFGTWVGAVNPNNRGWMTLTIYDTNDVNNEGLPRFCGGSYQTCANSLYQFSTYGFKFISRRI